MDDFLPNQVCKDVFSIHVKNHLFGKNAKTKWIFEHHSCGHLNVPFYKKICLNLANIIESILDNKHFT